MGDANLLLVEGPDDSSVLYHLLRHYQIPVAGRNASDPAEITIQNCEGDMRLLENLRFRLKFEDTDAPLRCIGVIIDADTGIDARWKSLYAILRASGYPNIPETPQHDGTIITADDRVAVGIWLMPNNQLPGKLEDFIQFLLPTDDRLWGRAGLVLQDIPEAERLFSATDSIKAHVHTWLAWQKEPGRPMGQAITKRFLDANSTHAQLLIAWIRRLFALG